MKKNLLKTVCIVLVAILCVGSLTAQNQQNSSSKGIRLSLSQQSNVDNGTLSFINYDNGKEPIHHSKDDDWELSWCTFPPNPSADLHALGSTGDQSEFRVAARFTPADMIDNGVNFGDELTKVRFVANNNDNRIASVVIEIYQGSVNLTNPGTLKYQQSVPPSSIVSAEWTEVDLQTPVVIDNSQELWIGYYISSVVAPGANHTACWETFTPRVPGKGNLILWSGSSWSNLFDLAGGLASYDGNWLLEGHIVPGTPDPCDPVTDLVVNYQMNCNADLTWTGHDEAESYIIFKNGYQIDQTNDTFYTDQNVDPYLENKWEVKVRCKNEASSPSEFADGGICSECPGVPELLVQYENKPDDCSVNLSWEAPLLPSESIQHCDVYAEGSYWGINFSSPPAVIDFVHAIRFTPLDLSLRGVVSGQLLTGATWILGQGKEFFIDDIELIVWQGGTAVAYPGEIVSTTYFDYTDVEELEDIFVSIDPPVVIDATKELRIGFRVKWQGNASGVRTQFTDDGPAARDFNGSVVRYGENWYTFETLLVTPPDENYLITATIEVGDADPEWEYNIYRDEELIAANITETTYTDEASNFDASEPHSWAVKINCFYEGVSNAYTQDLDYCSLAINEPVKTGFSIQPNPAKDNIKITAENDFNQVEIVNFLGQTVLSQSNEGNISNVNVSNLSNGVYFIRIISNQATSIQKFVKQ